MMQVLNANSTAERIVTESINQPQFTAGQNNGHEKIVTCYHGGPKPKDRR